MREIIAHRGAWRNWVYGLDRKPRVLLRRSSINSQFGCCLRNAATAPAVAAPYPLQVPWIAFSLELDANFSNWSSDNEYVSNSITRGISIRSNSSRRDNPLSSATDNPPNNFKRFNRRQPARATADLSFLPPRHSSSKLGKCFKLASPLPRISVDSRFKYDSSGWPSKAERPPSVTAVDEMS